MTPEPKVEVIGYVWISNGGPKACEQCRALNGQEFFFDPEPGGKNVSDMPEAPLHPNCRCTVQPITRVSVELPEGGGTAGDSYIQGGRKFAGGYWMNNGRSIFDGPVWKKWCGGDWGGGRDLRDPNAVGPADASPADDMDQACKNHDDCYGAGGKNLCDRKLVEELRSLPADPRQWKYPPAEDEVKDAAAFRKWAIRWFEVQIFLREYGERLVFPLSELRRTP